jgi:glycosyltransferase involved in cell wall biosynthesis
MDLPLVTIITVTYNSSKFVRTAIEGVLCQTYTNIEYILADDCSTDNTWDIIQQYKDPRIIAYRNETNLKEYPNRNKALSLAKGEYLIFIDGDDVIYPSAIEYFLNYAKKFPMAALLIQKNYYNHILFPVLLSPKETFQNIYFGKRNLIVSSFTSNFFKTNSLKGIGGLSTKYISGDDEVRLRIGLQYPVLLIQGWVSWPRETPNSASSKIDTIKANMESKEMLFALPNFIDDKVISNDMILHAFKYKTKNICFDILVMIKKIQFVEAFLLAKIYKINLFNFIKILLYNKKYIDKFDAYSAENPYQKEFDLNYPNNEYSKSE